VKRTSMKKHPKKQTIRHQSIMIVRRVAWDNIV